MVASARIVVSWSAVSLRARVRYRAATGALRCDCQRRDGWDSSRKLGKRIRQVPVGMMEDAEPIPHRTRPLVLESIAVRLVSLPWTPVGSNRYRAMAA